MAKEKKKGKFFSHIVSISFFTVIGVIWGFAMIAFLEWQLPEGLPSSTKAVRTFIMLALLFLTGFLHIVIHEAGHLVCGLLSGYSFSSFRVGSFMLLNEDGKLVIKRLKIAGTGGQCLMVPPEMVNGTFPVALYNLGGPISNLIVSLVFLPVLILAPQGGYFALFSFLMIGVGIVFGMSNGVPLRTKSVDNDGYNAVSLRKNKEAMRAFWIQMKVNEQLRHGVRTKDMPDDWFQVPSNEAMKNSMVATIGVYAASRLMDQHKFDEAEALISHILEIETGIVAIHRNLLLCDLIYLELIGQNRSDRLDELYSKALKKFIKTMKAFPSIIRMEYAYYLLAAGDPDMAARMKVSFEKVAATYPYPNDINTERELIQIADDKAA